MSKAKVTLSMEEDKIKHFKKIAIDKGITLSDLLLNAADKICGYSYLEQNKKDFGENFEKLNK